MCSSCIAQDILQVELMPRYTLQLVQMICFVDIEILSLISLVVKSRSCNPTYLENTKLGKSDLVCMERCRQFLWQRRILLNSILCFNQPQFFLPQEMDYYWAMGQSGHDTGVCSLLPFILISWSLMWKSSIRVQTSCMWALLKLGHPHFILLILIKCLCISVGAVHLECTTEMGRKENFKDSSYDILWHLWVLTALKYHSILTQYVL